MVMSKNDDNRCNCEKIFPKEHLNCCCDKEKRDCSCEDSDYKCCMKITPRKCCENGSDSSNKQCSCGKIREGEDQWSCSIKRDSDDQDKCCCEKNGKMKCCCSVVQETPCCCIVAGNDDCCCDHEGEDNPKSSTERSSSSEFIGTSRVIEKTKVEKDLSKQSDHSETTPKGFSTTDVKNTPSNDEKPCICKRSCDSSCVKLSDLVEEIPLDLEDPSLLTSTCLASTKDNSSFKQIDENLVSELKEFKKSSFSQESYDVYIVNDEGRVNSFELKHFVNSEKKKNQSVDSNPKEVFLNKQVHGICIKNKQSEMSSTYQNKMKIILDKIKEQNNNETLKPNEPTILEITEFSMSNKDKTTEVIKNVFVKDITSTCRCNGRSSCLCECNVSKVEIIQGPGSRSDPPLHFTDMKSVSCDADALNKEVIKINKSVKSNTTKNIVKEANESEYYDHHADSGDENESKNKLYYSINTSSESDFDTSIEDQVQNTNPDKLDHESTPKEKVMRSSQHIDSPFDDDMKNKIEDMIDSHNNPADAPIETININIGGNAIIDQGLEVTTFKMNIHGDGIDEKVDANEETTSNDHKTTLSEEEMKEEKDTSDKPVMSSIHESSRRELEMLQATLDKQAENEEKTTSKETTEKAASKIEEKIGFFGVKLGNVIKNIFEGSNNEQTSTSSSFSASGSSDLSESNKHSEIKTISSSVSGNSLSSASSGKSKDINVKSTPSEPNKYKDVKSKTSIDKSSSTIPSKQSDGKSTEKFSEGPSSIKKTPDKPQKSSVVEDTKTNLYDRTFISYRDVQNSSSSTMSKSVDNVATSKSASNSSRVSNSAVSCLAKTRKSGNTIEIALHLTNSQIMDDKSSPDETSTITFIEQDNEEISSCLKQVKRNNKVGKLIEYFEELEKKR